jgi:hydrogenase/urease accessory protein HupE
MRLISGFLLLLCLSSVASAHKLAPSLLELRELPSGVFSVMWRTPVLASTPPTVVFPASCHEIGQLEQTVEEGAIEQRYSILCTGAADKLSVSFNNVSASRSVVLLRWYGIEGSEQQVLLSSDEDTFSPKGQASGQSPILQFTGLGIKHILIGADHLLFVLGLLLIAASRRRLLVWISAFTVGHSITLVLVSLGVIPRWPALAELLIAGSVLLMALYADRRGQRVSGKAFVVLVAAFGLLHGSGFASVLDELMVTRGNLLPALLGFNIGIELGQVFFIATIVLLLMAMNRILATRLSWRVSCLLAARTATIYLMGAASMYWMIDRGLTLFEATFRGVY